MTGRRQNTRGAPGTAGSRARALPARHRSRLAAVTAVCLGLPESVRMLHREHAEFRVRGKLFAYFLDNHHGDGIVSVCVRSELGENVDRVQREPRRFYLPAHIGARGWFGLRLDRGRVDWREVAAVVERSWCLAAPKRPVRAREAAARQNQL